MKYILYVKPRQEKLLIRRLRTDTNTRNVCNSSCSKGAVSSADSLWFFFFVFFVLYFKNSQKKKALQMTLPFYANTAQAVDVIWDLMCTPKS